MRLYLILVLGLALSFLIACEPCNCPSTVYKLNSVYSVNGTNYTYKITVPVCNFSNNITTICSAYDNNTGRCALRIE